MKKIKFVFLVIACEKNFSRLRKFKSQKWFCDFIKREDVELLIALGGNKKTQKKGDVLFLKTPEKMQNLSIKLFESLKFIKKNYDFDFLIKCDDDIKVKNFEKVVNLFQKRDYSGIIRKTTKKRFFLWALKNDLKVDLDKHIEVDYAIGIMNCISKKCFLAIFNELPKLVKYTTKYLGGNNDILIGLAFKNALKKQKLTKSTKKEISFFKKNIKENFELKKLSPKYLFNRFFKKIV